MDFSVDRRRVPYPLSLFTTIEITHLLPDGSCAQFQISGEKSEDCLQLVNEFMASGCQPITIRCTMGGYWHGLPIAIFDGEDFRAPIHRLKQEWETLLLTPNA